MKKKILWIVLTLSLAVNISGLGTIGYHYWRNTCITPAAPCPLNPEDAHLYQSLGLSPDQLAKMTALAGSFHRRLNELEAAVADKRNLLIDALGEEKTDLSKTETLRKEIAGYQDEIQKEVITHIAESKKIMTPDQKKRFIELLRVSSNNGRVHSPFSPNGGNP
ncbi:MAG: periplasmic heavy metal sensor [Deltaproteobacteria bacterium]|nr:periplasmic heavy metal sensor [Deltaproteobacteria bacterium]